jgi:hypothetical protein
VAFAGVMHAIASRKFMKETLAALEISPPVKARLLADPPRRIYFQNPGEFAVASYYEPDARLRSRLALVYSREREMRWNHRDTSYITELHLRRFTELPIADFESIRAAPGEQFFSVYEDLPGERAGYGWNWTEQAFAAARARVAQIGPGFGGKVVSVCFHP